MAEFSQELFDKICDRIANGESLRGICQDEDMPTIWTFLRWADADEANSQQYARAREANGDFHGHSVATVIEKVISGEISPDVARVAIDGHKWTAGQHKPKVYGKKLDLNHSGGFNVTMSDDDSKL